MSSDNESVCSYCYSPDPREDAEGNSDQEEEYRSGIRRRGESSNPGTKRKRLNTTGEYSTREIDEFGSESEGETGYEKENEFCFFSGPKAYQINARRDFGEAWAGRQGQCVLPIADSYGLDRWSSSTSATTDDHFKHQSLEGEKVLIEEDFIFDQSRDEYYIKSDQTERDRVKGVLVEALRQKPPRARVLHDVYEVLPVSGGIRMDLGGPGRTNSGTFIFISNHDGDHIHVVHDCAYSNRSCRCQGLNDALRGNTAIGRRFSRRAVSVFDFTVDHWVNLANYLQKDTRQYCYVELAGRTWLPSSETRCIRFFQDLQSLQGSMVETSELSSNVPGFFACGPKDTACTKSSVASSCGLEEDSQPEKRGKGDEIIRFLQARPTSPVNHIFSTSVWLKSKYKFFDLNSVLIRNCIRIVNNTYNEMTFEEFYKFYEKCEPQNLIFNAPMGNVQDYYYSVDESVEILNNLLNFQFDNNHFKKVRFLTDLYNVLNKKLPKRNSIFVLSPPNAGKNFFFDAFIHYLINFGQMGNFNRYCNFPMMECVDRRVILWNEPVMEPSAAETLKMILGGDTVNAKVKYQADAVITRTPVIILSNNDIFPKDSAFRSRIFSYNWRQCENLKKYSKKPHPLACYKLMYTLGICL